MNRGLMLLGGGAVIALCWLAWSKSTERPPGALARARATFAPPVATPVPASQAFRISPFRPEGGAMRPESTISEPARLLAELQLLTGKALLDRLEALLTQGAAGRDVAFAFVRGLVSANPNGGQLAIVTHVLLAHAGDAPVQSIGAFLAIAKQAQIAKNDGDMSRGVMALSMMIGQELEGTAGTIGGSLDPALRDQLADAFATGARTVTDAGDGVLASIVLAFASGMQARERLISLSIDPRQDPMTRESALTGLGRKLPPGELLTQTGLTVSDRPEPGAQLSAQRGLLAALHNSVGQFPEAGAQAEGTFRRVLDNWTTSPDEDEGRLLVIGTLRDRRIAALDSTLLRLSTEETHPRVAAAARACLNRYAAK